jgi:hypothetical protein
MPDITFDCPACGQALEAPATFAGDALTCPACDAEIVVPLPPPSESDADPAAAVTFPNLPAIADAAVDEAYAEAAGNVCPGCGAELDPDVVLCVQCGFHTKLGKRIQTIFE